MRLEGMPRCARVITTHSHWLLFALSLRPMVGLWMEGVVDDPVTRAYEVRPPIFPSFEDLHEKLFGATYNSSDNQTHIIHSFSNPYNMRPSFNNFPHSNLLPEFFSNVLDVLYPDGGPRFIVEVGSLHGQSAIQMGTVLDKLGLETVPILCIDPFTGDLNMWASHRTDASVDRWTDVQDGRMMTFDQFMVNVRFAITRSLGSRHILPLAATSTVGARWLETFGYTPDLIFLDSAHEEHETFLEISLFFNVLLPGGILFGDDYGWPAVQRDVRRFVELNNRQHPDIPVDFSVAKARQDSSVLLWVMRKAKI